MRCSTTPRESWPWRGCPGSSGSFAHDLTKSPIRIKALVSRERGRPWRLVESDPCAGCESGAARVSSTSDRSFTGASLSTRGHSVTRSFGASRPPSSRAMIDGGGKNVTTFGPCSPPWMCYDAWRAWRSGQAARRATRLRSGLELRLTAVPKGGGEKTGRNKPAMATSAGNDTEKPGFLAPSQSQAEGPVP